VRPRQQMLLCHAMLLAAYNCWQQLAPGVPEYAGYVAAVTHTAAVHAGSLLSCSTLVCAMCRDKPVFHFYLCHRCCCCSLYVEKIDVGEAEPRTIVSG
jgi:hypothetical protein